jgi:NAD-reducing hydrogenase small subunit
MTTINERKTLATVWLDGCSGCHMSFLDMDERVLGLAEHVALVYSPLVDRKDFPENVDFTLIEGAVSSDEDLKKIRLVRQRTKILISLGDCAVTANVPSMRNAFGVEAILNKANGVNVRQTSPFVPTLLPTARPVHAVVKVDVYVPGCPPSADTIFYILQELLAGRVPDISAHTRFGV